MSEILLKDTILNTILLDDYLEQYHFSKKQKHLLKMEKRILVNNQTINHNIHLYENDEIIINCTENTSDDLIPYDYDLEILYEDDCLLIVNKPIHMIVHSDGSDTQTLDHAVKAYYEKTNQVIPVRHIHRLDRDTSGCILYCKSSYLQPYFDHMMSTKQIRRTYLALVDGKIEKKQTINANIGKDRHANKYRVSPSGQNAITHIKPIKYQKKKTLVECILDTGRTHQIRVHLSSINHPLIGDELYGKKAKVRCCLHSHTITLFHPILKEEIKVTCELSEDIKLWMKK